MNDRKLTCLALCLSVASLGYAAWLHHRADYFAELALQKREKALAKHLSFELVGAYRGLGGNDNNWPKNPQTLEELIAPLIEAFDKFEDTSTPDTKTNSNSKVK